MEYGYSSGIYTKHVSRETPIRSVPAQEEIDALGGGKTARDWNARFELACQKCKDDNVTLVGGVAPTAIREIYGATEGMFGQNGTPGERGSRTTTCSCSRSRPVRAG